jgi:hypothetical protein
MPSRIDDYCGKTSSLYLRQARQSLNLVQNNLTKTAVGDETQCPGSFIQTHIEEDRKMSTKKDLERLACHLAGQYQSGLLPELQNKGWTIAWKSMLKELRCRCPDYSELEVGIALNQGFVNWGRCEEHLNHSKDQV